jgi:hypothetical protein
MSQTENTAPLAPIAAVRRAFDPDILYREELIKARSKRVQLLVMLGVLIAALAAETVAFALKVFDLSHVWLPVITGTALVFDALCVFVMPRRTALSYRAFFAAMRAYDDTVVVRADRFEFDEGAPVLPENVPVPEDYHGQCVEISYSVIKRAEADGQEITLDIKEGRARFVFIIPRAETPAEEWDKLTELIKSLNKSKVYKSKAKKEQEQKNT